MRTTRAVAVLASGLGVAALAACAPAPAPRETLATAPAAPPRCTVIQGERSLTDCERAASEHGDVNAAFAVAQYYDRSPRRSPVLALAWYERAAAAGHPGALRSLFDAYHYGSLAPRNAAKAEDYLKRAAAGGAQWALLITAKRAEESDPGAAFATYLRVAIAGNCYAQVRVARAYVDGDLTAVNLPHGYFWSLLAVVDNYERKFDGHGLLRGASVPWADDACALVPIAVPRLETSLPSATAQAVQDAAGAWRRGNPEPTLPAFAGPVQPGDRSGSPPIAAARAPSRGGRWPGWQPVAAAPAAPVADRREASDLFTLAARSVWLVTAVRSPDDRALDVGASVGSAVAVSPSRLVTNCHVIRDRPTIYVKQAETLRPVTVVAADPGTDRCVLGVEEATLVPVAGMRRYADLRVGEPVFTIGAPRGLEQTLGQGLVSGLRRRTTARLIQTTAQISPGSSGGGLFDQAGNLVGVTTFMLRESDGLNFAIAIEDYFER